MKTTTRTTRLTWPAAAALVAGLLWTSGCTTHRDYGAFIREPRPVVTATEYRLAPPDVIAINSKRVREIHGHSEQIRPDGKITLPLLGSLYVAGHTAEEVAVQLQELALAYYDDADVTVRIVGFNSKKIYVFGETALRGALPYDGANTVLETLAVAQPTRLADPNQILVLRPNRDGQLVRRMTISLDDMVKKGDTSLDAVLEEGDILYVPPNPLAAVGLTLQQLLLPIQPAASVVAGPGDIDSSVRGRPYANAATGGAP